MYIRTKDVDCPKPGCIRDPRHRERTRLVIEVQPRDGGDHWMRLDFRMRCPNCLSEWRGGIPLSEVIYEPGEKQEGDT